MHRGRFCALALAAAGGCGTYAGITRQEQFTASNGRIFRSESEPDSYRAALRASAAHDLPCAPEQVTFAADAIATLDGCGWRVQYRRVADPAAYQYHFELLSRSALPR